MARAPLPLSLIDDADLVLPRGRRPSAPLELVLVRELTEADRGDIAAPPAQGTKPPALNKIRHTHHQLARALAQGHSDVEAGFITGYSQAYISNLKNDPAFAELLTHYQTNKELVFVDVAERMKRLGLATLEELQERLEHEPDGFTHAQLMELAELTLLKGRSAPGAASGPTSGSGGIALQISFNNGPGPSGPTIEGSVENGQ